jgi:hypothetical protein
MKSLSLPITLVIGLMLITASLSAQDNLKRGYIITLKGDTVHGLIDVSGWGMNPSNVLFKTYPGDEGTSYDPYDIKQFGIGNEVWEGGFVDVEVSSQSDGQLSEDPNLFLEKDLVFLQAIIKGNKSLFVYRKTINELFYIKTDSTYELLVYKKYLKTSKVDGSWKTTTNTVENKRYVGQLLIYLGDCPQIKSKINNAKYEIEALKGLFKEYYKCTGENVQIIKPEKNISFKLSLIAGYSIRKLDFDFLTKDPNNPNDPVTFNTYPFGAAVEISRPVSNPTWSFYTEFKLLNFYRYQKVTRITENESYTVKSLDYRAKSTQWTNMIRYTRPVNRWSLFANAGITSELLKGSDYSTVTVTILGNKSNYHKDTTGKYRALRACAGVGARYSHFSLETRYETWNLGKVAGPAVSFLASYTF